MTAVIQFMSLTTKVGASVASLLMVMAGSLVNAAESQPSYVMTVIADRAHGEQLVSGEYKEAIAAITSPTSPQKRYKDTFAVSNNLCVAYTKSNDLAKAHQACAEALRMSKNSFGPWYDATRKRSDQALALSNRGVIRAITGDDDGAREDFQLAIKLGRKLSAPLENLARLDSEAAETVSSL